MVYDCPEYDLKTCYRNLTFKVRKKNSEATNRQNLQKQSKKNDNFQPSVAFDTVPFTLGYSSIHDSREGFLGVPVPNDYTMEECYDKETDSLSANLQYYLKDTFQSPSLKARKEDDSVSNIPPIKSPKLLKKRTDIKKIFLVSQNGKIVRRDYPSTSVITNEALMVNKLEKNWNKLWRQRKAQINERLNEKKKWFVQPDIIFPKEHIKPLYRGDDATPCTKEQRRKHKIFQQKIGYPNNPKTILCYISGRRHTWVALDWTLCKIAQDMDHIVVLTTLPRLICNKKKGRKGDTEWASGYQKESIDRKLSDIFEYILQLLKAVKASVKVTLEIVIGKTKKSLVDAINVYTPDFLVIATLKHERNEKLIIYKSKKLADVFAVSFPIPVLIVPSKRMYSFELNLQRKMNGCINNSSNTHINNENTDRNNTNDSPFENNEIVAISSEISLDSFAEDFKKKNSINKHSNSSNEYIRKKLLSVAKTSREKITDDLKTLHNDKQQRKCSPKDIKLTKIDIIIKESLKSSLKIDRMPGNDSSHSDHNKNIANLKNSLIGNQSKGTEYRKSLIPYSPSQEQLHLDTVLPSTSPTSQIKFANSVKHKDGRAALGKVKNLADMEHTRSFEEENLTTDLPDNRSSVDNDISLRKVKSTGTLRKVKSNDSSSSSGSRKSSSSYTTANAFTGGGVGIFRVFKSGSSSGNKSSSNRRRSTGSDVLDNSDRSGKKKKKKKKSLFSVW
ncbi:hypothetical protein GRS66_007973 [Saccharomyces pastorianus]|uniref:UspA domain-containing protein n=1 Tax=Saccharomyces pastorianus TaxID=27292 RepID=A0A6C1E7U9_SACPS|nr:hypothetical protein GRS66_007973 [Saccharomyces pastorianus]